MPVINKYAPDGTFIAGVQYSGAFPNPPNTGPPQGIPSDGVSGWAGARGITYSAASNQLYVSSKQNCISVFNTDLTEDVANNIGNPTNGSPKAIGSVTECCPTMASIVLDMAICIDVAAGENIDLQSLLACEGIIAEGTWLETSDTVGSGALLGLLKGTPRSRVLPLWTTFRL